MIKFILKRILAGMVVLLGVIVVTFAVTRLVPSKPELQWVGTRATAEQLEAARIELGLDKSVPEQFIIYLKDLLHGDLGMSLQTKRPVADEIREYLPPTLELVLISTIFAVILGLGLGVLSASQKNRWQDHLARFFSVGTVSLPTFWTALLFQVLFYKILQLLPVGGMLSNHTQLFYQVPHVTGFLLLDCLLTGNFYILKERAVLWKYALKNSLGPTATVVTLSIGYTLMNTFLVESIFNWPGIGSYISDAVMNMNYPAIMGVTIISAIAYVFLNLIADIIVAMDPRVRV